MAGQILGLCRLKNEDLITLGTRPSSRGASGNAKHCYERSIQKKKSSVQWKNSVGVGQAEYGERGAESRPPGNLFRWSKR